MKPLKTKAYKEKAKKKSQILTVIISGLLALLMLFSVIGYSFLNRRGIESGRNVNVLETIEYKGIEFQRISTGWQFEIQGNKFLTMYNPQEVQNITINFPISLQEYYNKPLYFVDEDDSQRVVQELGGNLGDFVLRIRESCLDKECSEEKNLPIKSCDNSEHNIIIIKESASSFLIREGNCVFIEGKYSENIKTADALLFKILGI